MRIVERPQVKGGFVPCVECGVGTRSHVLESAEYEEYEEVWEDDDLQEYQGRKKQEEEEEEEDIVIRYRLHNEQVCMCHKCWTPKRKKAVAFLVSNKDTWAKESSYHLRRITKFLKSWNYYRFDGELELAYREDIETVRNALKSAGSGEEE